ncbi:MAG: dihydroorotate dehydrogenase [Candidatus Marinimicrobia bacterium]|nr:dihydroorotate dehydrogenase [Candidatus Neomarinimicrobiota bacterium]
MADLSVKIGSVDFKNPIFTASGTFGYGTEVSDLTDISALGAIITKSITLHSREGNPPPRIVETTGGMINSIGLANIGVDQFIAEMLPAYKFFETAVIVNIAGSTVEEYCQVLKIIDAVSSNIAGYEINISCPNVKEGGMAFGVSADTTARLTERLRKLTERLIILKLSPNVTDITVIGKAAQEAGADAVSAINTLVGMSINHLSRESNIFTTYGGLSGPAIKPIALACVHKLASSLEIPVLGIGGITAIPDVVEFTLAGATAIQIGTANFRDPDIGRKIVFDLVEYCKQDKIESFDSLIGQVRVFQ